MGSVERHSTPPRSPIVLGVDGGNSKTIALVVDGDGRIVGAGRAGCADIYGAGSPDGALDNLDTAVKTALRQAGIRPDVLAASVFSMAGADWPEDFALLEAAISSRGYGASTRVVNDAIGALRAGTPDGVGVVVACGTGVATGACGTDGRCWHSSFWHEPAGGGWLGRQALRAIYRAALEIDPPTVLTPRVLATLGEPSVETVLHTRTRRGAAGRWSDDAALAPVVLQAAHEGDPAALRIVHDAGSTLGEYAVAAARQVGLTGSIPLVLTGGIFRHSCGTLRGVVLQRVRRDMPEVRPVHSEFEPAVGAVLLAFDAFQQPVSNAMFAWLRATMPEPGFFATCPSNGD